MPLHKGQKRLARIVEEHPLPAFAEWWELGDIFIKLISAAIWDQWQSLDSPAQDLVRVHELLNAYLKVVYHKDPDPLLVDEFIKATPRRLFYSGEFDALSFAFYRSAFEIFEEKYCSQVDVFESERRQFTRRVGKQFFAAVSNHLQLSLPSNLRDLDKFHQLQTAIDKIGQFLLEGGYLKNTFRFTFSVQEVHLGKRIVQAENDFIENLHSTGTAYALYVMGYPAILPSAVYLYQLCGEAQHHSSRMIEELFDRIGYKASEVDDFDPSKYPSDKVVELWSISI